MKSEFDKTLMHGVDYTTQDLTGYYATEKFDGHRFRWQQGALFTRLGNRVDAPDWITARLPAVRVDGEIYSTPEGGHNDVKSLLQRGAWHKLKLIPFDLPDCFGDYLTRNKAMRNLPFCQTLENTVEVWTLESTGHAIELLKEISDRRGEGLVLHKPGSPYTSRISSNVIKFKPRHVGSALFAMQFSGLVKTQNSKRKAIV